MAKKRMRGGANKSPGVRFIDPKVLARIDNLELLAQTVVDGFVNGLHASPHLGFSIDFAQHRQYELGDDIRRIDWRLWARTDRYYLMQFEAETNSDLMLVLDVSRSMGFGSEGIPKLDYARYLLACLAYFSTGQKDRVGFVTFDSELKGYIPPSGRRLDLILHHLHKAEASESGVFEMPLIKVAENMRRRGIVVIVSDLYQEPEAIVATIDKVRASGQDVVVFHVLDPSELEFPFDGVSTFEDLESGEQIPIVPETMRDQYKALVRSHIETLEAKFSGRRVDYMLVDTSKPLDEALFKFLSARKRFQRVR